MEEKRNTSWDDPILSDGDMPSKIMENHIKTFTLGNLTPKETQEIVTLDYVLTWGYDKPGDLERYKELSEKRWGEKI